MTFLLLLLLFIIIIIIITFIICIANLLQWYTVRIINYV